MASGTETRRFSAAAIVVAVCAAFLLGGWFLKAQCLDPWAGSHQYESLCYNDIQALYQARGVDQRVFPYVHGSFDASTNELRDGAIEYPVLTGLFMYAAGTGVDNANGYLIATAMLLFPFGLLVAFLLGRLEGWRALMWAASPALVLYSFHNWDLLVVAAAAAGFYAYRRGHPVAAAALFALGAAFKMYPAFFVLPLIAAALARRNAKEAASVAGTAAGVFALVNLPFAIVNFEGWWATYGFHRVRGPNFDNIWNLISNLRDAFQVPVDLPVLPRFTLGIPDLTPEELNLITGVLTLVAFGIALWVGWNRARKEGLYPVVAVSAALLAAFMLFSKVHSPQYTLWLLPFFVLVRVNVLWWIAYAAADLLVYVGVFRFFFDYFENPGATGAETAMEVGVWVRAALLAGLFVAFLRVREGAGGERTDALTSHPLPRVEPVGVAAES